MNVHMGISVNGQEGKTAVNEFITVFFFLPMINLLTKLTVPTGCVNGKNNDV